MKWTTCLALVCAVQSFQMFPWQPKRSSRLPVSWRRGFSSMSPEAPNQPQDLSSPRLIDEDDRHWGRKPEGTKNHDNFLRLGLLHDLIQKEVTKDRRAKDLFPVGYLDQNDLDALSGKVGQGSGWYNSQLFGSAPRFQVRCLAIVWSMSPNFSRCHSSRRVASGLPNSSSGRDILPDTFGCQLIPACSAVYPTQRRKGAFDWVAPLPVFWQFQQGF